MRQKRHGYALSVTLLASLIGFATTSTSAAEIKIGYVNAVKVIEQAPQREAALKKLEAEFTPRDKKLVEMQQEIRKAEEDLEKNRLVMKDTERRDKESQLGALKRDLRRETQEFREDLNARRNEELAALQKMVQQVIVEIAKQENYDLILEGAVYASSSVDITDRVLEKLSKKAAQK
jgi:outer membrane protein